ncbi:hypothetical protein ACFL6B_04730 [Thermodesulfobacteriota bacterium]
MKQSLPETYDIEHRFTELYTLGHQGAITEAPFYLHALGFDGKPGKLGAELISSFNQLAQKDDELSKYALDLPDAALFPETIVLIDASNDRLPTGPESFRVLQDKIVRKEIKAQCHLVNTREELMAAVTENPKSTLVISECVDSSAYNIDILETLEDMGVVVSPGRVTAPGSIFSNKGTTYQMLQDAGQEDLLARYVTVPAEKMNTSQVVSTILDSVDKFSREWNTRRFFVKPVTGGSGVGGFRISRTDSGYFVPDLSKVTGDALEIHPIRMDVGPHDNHRLDELLWIFSLFSSDPYYAKQYMWVDLETLKNRYGTESDPEALRQHLLKTSAIQTEKTEERSLDRNNMHAKLEKAIKQYEAHFSKRYDPVFCEHIDFGAWGLRAHYRLTHRGIQLESIYARIFQMALTEEGVSYVGSDNISNKHTGVLESVRLTPITKAMVNTVGGRTAFLDLLRKGGIAASTLVSTQEPELRRRIPVRCQLDLAPIDGKIGEGNADTARGQALGTRWPSFVADMREWFQDCLKYYSLCRSDSKET